ncbi:uncharacterized protein N7484_011562 [Penicillium longicatenatum]|uniref:uncharacterized protein n=1 Tax=Penicillium longicatenatum TaxID=1561947 RepID=UPI002548CFF9|nr:uncharacterized protein N7484_011562 [Penicillium longicatenatum]KAJ5631462.1 hypothetical protein N7484_011562 [Penicillium longicatenatum]
MAEGAVLKYGERQVRGIFRMNWMLKPVTALLCKIEQSTLVINDLPWYESGKDDLSNGTMNTMELFGIPFRDDYHALIAWSSNSTPNFADQSFFQGIFSDGLIVIEKMFREKAGAHISDVALAMYRHSYDIDNLKQIVICDIVNVDTVEFFQEDLYIGKNNLDYSGNAGVQNWPHPTPEYLALLATEICSVGVNIVLGAWPRGTHYIANIQTSVGGRPGDSKINILMEVAKIPTDLTKMPQLAKETKAALLEAMDMDPHVLDSGSSKGTESGQTSVSGKNSESSKGKASKKRKSEESEELEGSETSAKKKKTEVSKKRKAEGSEVEVGGGAKKKKAGEPRKSGRIAKKEVEKAENEAGYDSQMEVDEGDEMDVDEEQTPAKPAKKKTPRRAPVPKRGRGR